MWGENVETVYSLGETRKLTDKDGNTFISYRFPPNTCDCGICGDNETSPIMRERYTIDSGNYLTHLPMSHKWDYSNIIYNIYNDDGSINQELEYLNNSIILKLSEKSVGAGNNIMNNYEIYFKNGTKFFVNRKEINGIAFMLSEMVPKITKVKMIRPV